MDYRQAEQALLLGVLDAIPCPTVLLNRSGQTVYVNEKPCPVSLDTVDFAALPEVKTALDGIRQTARRTDLRGPYGSAWGLLELHPVMTEDSQVGVLAMFRPDPVREELSSDALPTVSDAMNAVWDRLQRLATLSTPALIMGEPGLGKESFARALHQLSARAERPFIVVYREDSPERFRAKALEAGGGALLCLGIDRWPGPLLSEAATLFASRHIVQGLDVLPLEARLMATAGPELPERVAKGAFPSELFARMNIMPVFIPALRDRREDIMPAAARYAQTFAAAAGKDIQGFAEEARDTLLRQEWRNNLDGLRGIIEEAVKACPGGLILAGNLGALYRNASAGPGQLRKMRDAYGRDHIRALLATYGYSVEGKRKAAAELGISLSTLYRVLGSKKS